MSYIFPSDQDRADYNQLNEACEHIEELMDQLASRQALEGETVRGYSYELATCTDEDGEYCNWSLSINHQKPNVPADSIRNLEPLYTHPASADVPDIPERNKRINKLMGNLWDVFTDNDPYVQTKINAVWDLLVKFEAQTLTTPVSADVEFDIQKESWRHEAEDLQALNQNLNNAGVPRYENGVELSAWGRVLRMNQNPASIVVPKGWKLVPVETTQWIRTQGEEGFENCSVIETWARMLRAAPEPPIKGPLA